MKITDEIKQLFPEADVYWNRNDYSLSIMFYNNPNIDTQTVHTKVAWELSLLGLTRAVERVNVYVVK